MNWTTLILAIIGFGLMASGGALLACDIYLAGQHRRLVRGERLNRNVHTRVAQDCYRIGSEAAGMNSARQ